MSIEIGAVAPGFDLPDTHGDSWGPVGGSATVVVFTCNHCPYALAWHRRLLEVGSDYAGRGVRMLLICSNDAERYPHDSFEAMRARVDEEGPWPAPYLHDETQDVARAFGAQTTPDVFLLDADGKLRYRGAPDADHGDESRNAKWLRAALEAVLAGDPVAEAITKPVGCSIKWREPA
jgi:peroxiredoxin